MTEIHWMLAIAQTDGEGSTVIDGPCVGAKVPETRGELVSFLKSLIRTLEERDPEDDDPTRWGVEP